MDAIVTGAEGFLGRALVARLQRQGVETLAVSRAAGDIADGKTWGKLPPARTVFHLAARSYVPDSWEQAADFIHTNAIGTQRALDYCRKHSSALVLASAYVYGIPQTLPISEQHTPHPNNPYALSKIMAERVCEFAAEFQHVPVTVLRIFNIYGNGMRPEFLIPIIADTIRKRDTITVLDLLPKRDYVYIEDVLDALMLAAEKPSGFRRVNIASGESYSVQDIIDMFQSTAGTNLPVISKAVERRQEIPDVKADIRLAKELLGWSPSYSMQDGIRHMLAQACVK